MKTMRRLSSFSELLNRCALSDTSIRFMQTEIPEVSQSRFINSCSNNLRIVAREEILNIPEVVIMGSIFYSIAFYLSRRRPSHAFSLLILLFVPAALLDSIQSLVAFVG